MHDQSGMVQQCPACRRWPNAAPASLQQRHAHLRLQAPHARAGRSEGEAGPRRTGRYAARLGHMQEQAQVGQVEVYGAPG